MVVAAKPTQLPSNLAIDLLFQTTSMIPSIKTKNAKIISPSGNRTQLLQLLVPGFLIGLVGRAYVSRAWKSLI